MFFGQSRASVIVSIRYRIGLDVGIAKSHPRIWLQTGGSTHHAGVYYGGSKLLTHRQSKGAARSWVGDQSPTCLPWGKSSILV